jgi:ATP-dependent Clp protease adaptor protein ClpS
MATVTGLPEVKKRIDDERVPLYNVVLLDDDEHSYEYVIEMLQKLFAMSAEQGFQHAREVDTTGRTIVMTCELPEAEFGKEQIHAYGADPRMPQSKGSMSAIVEPA